MGSAPPHVALISGLDATGLGGEEIADALRRVARAHAPVVGRVLAKCKVTANGCVLVGVDCPGSLAIARALSAALPGADTYYASQHPDQQLITLGRFAGVDAVGFAKWLSESLAGQRALLPEFTCVSIQLSDEAHPFPNPQIPLSGGSGANDGRGIDSGLGLGLNLGVGLGLGGGFGGFDSGYGAMSGGSLVGGVGNYAAPATAVAHNAAAFGNVATSAVPVQPPMPSTPPPQRMHAAPLAPPSYASAIGIKAAALVSPAQTAPMPTSPAPRPTAAPSTPPTTPPGGSFAQRAAAAVASQHVAAPAQSPVAASQAHTPEQLLAAFQQLTARAEGAGVLGKDANGGYALRPRDSASWSQRLQPLVSLMQSTLASVGAARFLAMLDRVANPYGMSIAAELSASLSNGARVEIVQDMQLAAEVASTPVVSANEGAQVRLIATPVNQVGAAGHGSTGSCVIVGVAANRGVDPITGMIRVAPIALNLEPIANVNPPIQTSYLGLTFAWLVVSSVPSSAPAPVPAARVDGGAHVSSPSASVGVRRPGDWSCASCYAHNFASRSACFKCKASRHRGSGADTESDGGLSQGGKADSEQGGPSAGGFRPGDWICNGCRAHNFASRSSCFRCRERHSAGGEDEVRAETSGSNPDNFRSGDWICSGCRAHNFSSRTECYKCSRHSGLT